MLMGDCVVCRVLLEKKIVGLLVCDLFICNWKREKMIMKQFLIFFLKRKLRIILKKGGVWGINVYVYLKMKKYGGI